jgi:hypothetical protein
MFPIPQQSFCALEGIAPSNNKITEERARNLFIKISPVYNDLIFD